MNWYYRFRNTRTLHSDQSEIPIGRDGQSNQQQEKPRENTREERYVFIDDELVATHLYRTAPEFFVEEDVFIDIPERLAGIGVFHKAKIRLNGHDADSQIYEFVVALDIRNAFLFDMEEHGHLRNGAVSFQMQSQIHGYRIRDIRNGTGNEEYYGPIDDRHIPGPTVPQYAIVIGQLFFEIEKPLDVPMLDVLVVGFPDHFSSPSPCCDNQKYEASEGERDKSSLKEFDAVRHEESQIENEERAKNPYGNPGFPLPVLPCDDKHRYRGDEHDARNGKTVGRGESCGGTESDYQGSASNEQHEIYEWEVYLSFRQGIGMDNAETWEKFKDDGL